MAVVWQRQRDGALYEVRRAGRTLRLYRDGVLHTQYNPSRPLTLGVWDLMAIPAFGLSEPPQRVLVLGVGGGAVLRLLQQFFPGIELHGVDLDRAHLSLASRFFGVNHQTVNLHLADAREWLLDRANRDRFDMVIDDLFAGKGPQPHKVFAGDSGWFDLLTRRLKPGGVLVMNFAAMSDLSRSAWSTDESLRRRLRQGIALRIPHYANAVGAFYCEPVPLARLRAALTDDDLIGREIRKGRFSVSLKTLRVR